MNLLLDTSVLIDVLRARNGRRELLAELVRSGHTLSTSTLCVAEVFAGMRPSEEKQTEALLEELISHKLDDATARRAGKLQAEWKRKGRTLSLADSIVAATAIEQKFVLLTDNRRDFPMQELQFYPLP